MSIFTHVQELDGDADVFLYHLSKFNPENPAQVFKFSNFSGVSFNGSYEAIACSHDTFEVSSVGSQGRLQITVSDTNGSITGLVDEVNGLEGCELLILRTRSRFLDTGATPSTSAILQRSQLIISRVVSWIPLDTIVWEASNPIDYSDIGIPSRVCTPRCTWAQYRGPECSYSGAAMFDLAGNPVIDPKLDRCSRDLKGCRLRNNVINYGGFPSLQRR